LEESTATRQPLVLNDVIKNVGKA